MRREPDHFGDQELVLVYIGKKLKDALRLEQVFAEAGVDFMVETDSYRGGVVFQSERVGAFFYVAPENEAAAREVMHRIGFEAYQAG